MKRDLPANTRAADLVDRALGQAEQPTPDAHRARRGTIADAFDAIESGDLDRLNAIILADRIRRSGRPF